MKRIVFVIACASSLSASAATPAELLAQYQAEATKASSGFVPSAQRGGAFYVRHFSANAKMPACTSCHTDRPVQPGRHVVTDKPIKPLSPVANPERFTDPAKVEKWFKRNCTEVTGRECTPAEKADVIAFLLDGGGQ